MRLSLLLLLLCSMLTCYAQERGITAGNSKKDTAVITGNTYAVIVGISNYKYIKPLSFADQDAELFKEFLQSKSGGSVKEANILMVTNEDAKASTYPQIRHWVLDKKAQKGDRVYFYFAGHGDAIDADEYFFLLSDCNPAGDKNNYVGGMASVLPMYSIKSFIKNNLSEKGVQVVMIWDACRTNELPGGAEGQKIAQQGIAEKTSGELVMLSASAGETALENNSYAHGHGLFTYYLIDGLSGAADNLENGGNGDGKVDMSELDTWVKIQVKKDARSKFNSSQNPKFIYTADMPISVVDNQFTQAWALQKQSGNESFLARNNTTRSAIGEVDSMVTGYYNKCMKAMKSSNVEGERGAEALVKEMEKAYPKHDLTQQAKFNLAMEYINLAQDRINLYLSGIDDQRVFNTNEDGIELNRLQRTVGRTYAANAAFLQNAINILKESGEDDPVYLAQLEAKQNFFLARSYYSREGKVNSPEEALMYAKKALTAQPNAAYNQHMMGLLNFNNTDSAFLFEKRALAIAPHWVYALNSMGLIYARLKQYDSAQLYARKAIQNNPEYAPAYNSLATVLSTLKKNDSAKVYYWTARALNPKLTNTYNNLGAFYQKLRQYDSAKWYYRMADMIDPKYSYSATSGLGNIFYTLQQYDSAQWYMRKAVKSDPKFAYAYTMLGNIFLATRQYDSSLFYIRKSLAIDPRYPSAYNMAGIVFNVLKQYDSALLYFRTATLLDPAAAIFYANTGLVLTRMKQYDSAKYYGLRSVAIDPNYVFGYNTVASVYQQTRQTDSVIFWRRKAIQINPRYLNTYLFLADYFYELRKYDSTMAYASKALLIDPDYVDALNAMGRVYHINRKLDTARIYYQSILRKSPAYTVAYNNIGITFYDAKNFDSALWYYRKTILVDPNYRDVYAKLGITFGDLHQYDSAQKYLRRGLTIDPAFAAGNFNMGIVLRNMKQFDSAKFYFRQAINADPGNLSSYVYQGLNFNATKQYDSAKTYFRRAILATQTYMPAYCNLAANFLQEKQYDSANSVLQRAMATRKWNDSNYQSLFVISAQGRSPQENAYVYAARFLKGHASLEGVMVFSKAFLALVQPGQATIQGQKIASATRNADLQRFFLELTGTEYLDNNDYASAEQCFLQLKEISPSNGNYLLSNVYSRKNEVPKALDYLQQALAAGYNSFFAIGTEERLDAVRKTDKYTQLMQQYFPDRFK